MSPGSTIISAAIPGARVVGSRFENIPAASLPARSLGLGPFTAEERGGVARLLDAAGNSWGIFANVNLAAQTAAALSR